MKSFKSSGGNNTGKFARFFKTGKSRLTAGILALCMVITMLPGISLTAFATTAAWSYPTSAPATPFESGTGESSDPYIIKTAQQLANMAYLVNNDNTNYGGKHYKLDANIDLAGGNWTPIGYANSMEDYAFFAGSFDGAGYTISNLKLGTEDNQDNLGMFTGLLSVGIIKNVNLSDVNVMGRWGIGCIVNSSQGIIDNCHITSGTISGVSNVGAIVCSALNGSIVRNCSNKASIVYPENSATASGFAGIAAESWGAMIENCYNAGSITGLGRLAGIVAYQYEGSVTQNCYNIGTITGGTEKGGIVGYIDNPGYSLSGTKSEVNNCYYMSNKGVTSEYGIKGYGTVSYCDSFENAADTVSYNDTTDEISLVNALNNWVETKNSADYKSWTVTESQNNGYPILVKPHTHSWSADWTSDNTAHWHECTAANCNITENNQKDGYAVHTPNGDDGNCTTDIKCSVCQVVTTAAKASHSYDNDCDTECNNTGCTAGNRTTSHVPNTDDNNCTTEITCSVCNAVTKAAETDHSFINACDTSCNNAGCGYTRATTHTPNSDDGNCTTEITCSECNEVTTPAKAHTSKADDNDCTTAVYCGNTDCTQIVTPAMAHNFTDSCDTSCNNSGCGYTRAITHTPAADDGDCTTAVICSVCKAELQRGKPAHSFDDDYDASCNNTGCKHTRSVPQRHTHSNLQWVRTETEHWQTCTHCIERVGYWVHDYTPDNPDVCRICGYTKVKLTAKPAPTPQPETTPAPVPAETPVPTPRPTVAPAATPAAGNTNAPTGETPAENGGLPVIPIAAGVGIAVFLIFILAKRKKDDI